MRGIYTELKVQGQEKKAWRMGRIAYYIVATEMVVALSLFGLAALAVEQINFLHIGIVAAALAVTFWQMFGVQRILENILDWIDARYIQAEYYRDFSNLWKYERLERVLIAFCRGFKMEV